jgi:hypothetical protein
MANKLKVHKGRTNIITVNMGMDVSGDTITSEIRSEPEQGSPLIAEWGVEFTTDGTDGELTLTMDDLISGQITAKAGFMDIKRVSAGEPLPVFDTPLEVVFQGTVTA